MLQMDYHFMCRLSGCSYSGSRRPLNFPQCPGKGTALFWAEKVALEGDPLKLMQMADVYLKIACHRLHLFIHRTAV
jgi:hypothetical protein